MAHMTPTASHGIILTVHPRQYENHTKGSSRDPTVPRPILSIPLMLVAVYVNTRHEVLNYHLLVLLHTVSNCM